METAKLKAFLEECVNQKQIPGANFAIVTPHEIMVDSVGYRSLVPTNEMNNIDTIYDLASCSKVVSTTTIILMLLEQGKLSFKICVSDILNDFPHSDITIEHLLTHTSGYPADDKRYKHCKNKEDMKHFIYELERSYLPGSRVEYSDFGFIILGFVIEELVGDLDIYASKHLFNPLEMYHTSHHIAQADILLCAPTEVTTKRGVIRGIAHDGKANILNGVSGNAGVFSTIQDIANFAQMLLQKGSWNNKQILLPATINLLKESKTTSLNKQRTYGWESSDSEAYFGDYASKHCIFHTGFSGTSIYIDFDRNLAFILLTNRIHPTRDNLFIKNIRHIAHNLILSQVTI